ncbi:uncharacterized protein N7511_003953 [Penicillium nucicola]|uniref:uncharacterized protein n=1 Tax=Penicillium nucicola TaxID=1850975 RepID=UPI00254566E3|nr:uncharacterized protein N7511_003953 [Penicillium nucicola]KAJ5766337.1 hypothetical protein N7511_003953 [Penicillium nucicola]
MLFHVSFGGGISFLALVAFLLTRYFVTSFFPYLIFDQSNSCLPTADTIIMPDPGSRKDRKKSNKAKKAKKAKKVKFSQSVHSPAPLGASTRPIVYPTPASSERNGNDKKSKPAIDKRKSPDHGEASQSPPLEMPDSRTAFLCPHGFHFPGNYAGSNSDPSGDDENYFGCLVCDVMRDYHPYQPENADSDLGEHWIRHTDYICGVPTERASAPIPEVDVGVADRCLRLAQDLLAQQEKLLTDLRDWNNAPISDTDDAGDDSVKAKIDAVAEEKKEVKTKKKKKKSVQKPVRNKIPVDENAAKNELDQDSLDSAFRISVERMSSMDEKMLRMSLKELMSDEEKEELVLTHVMLERQRIADEKSITDENNVVKKRRDRKKKPLGLLDIIMKKRREDEKKEAEDKHVTEVMRGLLTQRIAEEKAEKKRAKKGKKANKNGKAKISDCDNDNDNDDTAPCLQLLEYLDRKQSASCLKKRVSNTNEPGPSK